MSNKKIRILHLIKSLEVGGIEKSTILYSNILVEEAEFIGIFSCEGFYDRSKILAPKIKRFYPKHLIFKKKYFIKNLFFLLRTIKNNKITHIHYHHRIFIPFVLVIKIYLPNLTLVYTHHSIFNDFINYFLIANRIVALNESTKKDLPKHLQTNAVIIPHGIEIGDRIHEFSKSVKNIGYVGRFVKFKGIETLINEFKIVNDKMNNSQLVFIGDGELKNTMLLRVNRLNLRGKVLFIDPEFNTEDIYSKIDILVLPSEKLEGFGLVILEAMANGIPVITSNLKPFLEIITNKVDGIHSNNKLSEDILSLLNDKILYQNIRKNALNMVKRKYDIKKITERYNNEIYL